MSCCSHLHESLSPPPCPLAGMQMFAALGSTVEFATGFQEGGQDGPALDSVRILNFSDSVGMRVDSV